MLTRSGPLPGASTVGVWTQEGPKPTSECVLREKIAMGNYPLGMCCPYPYPHENILPINLPIPLPMRVTGTHVLSLSMIPKMFANQNYMYQYISLPISVNSSNKQPT
jgi:hypothetical protein